MIIAGHQPQYLPYLGIFNKIAKADIFVFADNLQYEKKSWQNRTLIKSNRGEEIVLSIPVKTKQKLYQKINQVEISDHFWMKKHIKTLTCNYSKCIGFDEVFPLIENIFNKKNNFLVDYTIPMMLEVLNLLDIKTDVKFGSLLEIDGNKTELLVDITRKTEGDTYLSGAGAKVYFEKSIFEKENLGHKFNYFSHPVYYQGRSDFLKGMSAIDLLFYNGLEKGREIFWKNINENKSFE